MLFKNWLNDFIAKKNWKGWRACFLYNSKVRHEKERKIFREREKDSIMPLGRNNFAVLHFDF